MNAFQNPYLNPYGMVQQYPVQQPQVQVVKVSGENGARAYQIGPNSSALLLDESGLMVWLITSDGAGYKTVSAYDITPHKEMAAPDFGTLETRIRRLEDIVNGYTRNTNSDRKVQPNDAVSKANDRNGQQRPKPANRPPVPDGEQSAIQTGY